jgi:hypothetical protein
LARRLYGRYLSPRSEHVDARVAEIQEGRHTAEVEELKALELEQLRERYKARDIEPK